MPFGIIHMTGVYLKAENIPACIIYFMSALKNGDKLSGQCVCGTMNR